MPHTIHLSDDTVALAATQLVCAAEQLCATERSVPDTASAGCPLVTAELSEFVRAANVARQALRDAARHSSVQLGSLLRQHSDLDQLLGQRVPVMFSVPGAPR